MFIEALCITEFVVFYRKPGTTPVVVNPSKTAFKKKKAKKPKDTKNM
jgi:hypothetical protein